MEKIPSAALGLALLLFFSAPSLSQGIGGQKEYDWMGTPVVRDERSYDYLNPYDAGRPEWDPFGEGRYGMYSLLMVPASPEEEGLVVRGDLDRLQNQLYLQRGSELVTEGGVTLGEPYVLWAKVAGRGVFLLYDRGHLILNQGYVTPGWYRISGAYADFLGVHIYRFVSGSLQSNNLSVVAASGGYPTGFSLTGRVVDPGGQGIPGARVTASNSEGGRFSTATDASGYYALDLPTGTYLVNAERYGYAFYPTTAQVWTGLVAAARPIVGYPAGQPSPDS